MQNQSKYPHKAKLTHFSLIEMLVAIAILGVLTSLLNPALKKAIGTANGLQCASTLKELGQVDSAYADDHLSTFLDFKTIGESSSSYPTRWYQLTRHLDHATNGNAGKTFQHIPNALISYGWQKNNSNLLCPDERSIDQDILDKLTSYKGVTSYSYRGSLNGYYENGKWTTPIDFDDGPDLWLRFCSAPGGSNPSATEDLIARGEFGTSKYAYNLLLNPGAPTDLYRHYGDRINVLYLDLSIQTRQSFEYLDINAKKLNQDN
jgi:prepilin-type N-terminal cleavage/methylation domain-containing protein